MYGGKFPEGSGIPHLQVQLKDHHDNLVRAVLSTVCTETESESVYRTAAPPSLC